MAKATSKNSEWPHALPSPYNWRAEKGLFSFQIDGSESELLFEPPPSVFCRTIPSRPRDGIRFCKTRHLTVHSSPQKKILRKTARGPLHCGSLIVTGSGIGPSGAGGGRVRPFASGPPPWTTGGGEVRGSAVPPVRHVLRGRRRRGSDPRGRGPVALPSLPFGRTPSPVCPLVLFPSPLG